MPDPDDERRDAPDQKPNPGPSEPIEVTQALEAARARIADLELEQMRLLERRAEDLERENDRLREASPLPMSVASSKPGRTEALTPAYVAKALAAVEDHMSDMESFAGQGDHAAAAQAKVQAVTRTCSTFTRLCEDDRFHDLLMRIQPDGNTPAAPAVPQNVTGKITDAAFRELEVQTLELAGLSRSLAEQHVGAAIDAYLANPDSSIQRLRNPMAFLGDLRALRDATCQSADLLAAGVQRQQSRSRWKKILTLGLGGTLIVTANGIGTAFLGPGGVAASGAIGSAAVGAAVPLVT